MKKCLLRKETESAGCSVTYRFYVLRVVIRFTCNQEYISEEVTRGWTKMNTEVIHRERWGGFVERMWGVTNANEIFYRITKGKVRPLGISRCKWQLKVDDKWGCELQPSGSMWSPVETCCEDGNEQSVSIKCKELVEEMNDRWAVTKVFTTWSSLIG